MMAQAFPKSTFYGFDFHPGSIEQAKAHARDHGVTNAHFQVGTAKDYPEADLDLVTFFDCLHDMGDPAGASAHVKKSLKADGSWMVVEPMAGDRLEDNLNPIGRIYYAASTSCVRPDITGAGSRDSTWRTSGGRQTSRSDYGRRLRNSQTCSRNALQHGFGSARLGLLMPQSPDGDCGMATIRGCTASSRGV